MLNRLKAKVSNVVNRVRGRSPGRASGAAAGDIRKAAPSASARSSGS